MAIHKPYQRYFILPANAKLANVDSLLLNEGQFAVYDVEGEQTENGLKALTTLAGCPKDKQRYEIRVGRNKMIESRTSDDKSFSTPPFAINEIIDVYASAPKTDEIKVDKVLLGYNGINDETAIKGHKGDRIPVHLKMTGRPFEMLGYPMGEVVVDDYILLDRCPALVNACDPECNPCEEVDMLSAVMDCIERMKNQPIAGGGKVGDYVEITPIHKCTSPGTARQEIAMNFFCMEICDTGDAYALAMVQAAYPGLDIKRIDRKGFKSKYQVMKQGGAPETYTRKTASILKGCAECPSTYQEVKGGYVYAVTLEDAGVDESATVESETGAEASSTVKIGQNGNLGTYTFAKSKKFTKAEIDAYVESQPTAVVDFVAKTEAMCSNAATTTATWSACGSCKVAKDVYTITLPDDECKGSALNDLKAAFPKMNIKDHGAPSGCQHQFKGEVVTSMVCEECDPMFKDLYVSEKPEAYMGRNWQFAGALGSNGSDIVNAMPTDCKCGIMFTGIDYLVSPSDCLVDKLIYEEGSVKIAVNGGYPDEQREAISSYFHPLHVEYQSHWAPRTHIGAELIDKERESHQFFDGRSMHHDYMERVFTNEETRLDFRTQYADFAVTLKPARYSNGYGRVMDDHITYHFFVPYGAHEGVQAFMDLLAGASGVTPCKI